MLQINLQWDANALAAPQSFRDGVQAAANMLDAAILNQITVNVVVGYGEFDLGGPQYTPLPANYSLGGATNLAPISYQALRAALVAHANTTAATLAAYSLPDTVALNGQSQFRISSALGKALGTVAANAPAVDGYIGLPTNVTGNTLTGLAVTELVHALGVLNTGGDLGLVSYTAPGVHFLPTSATSVANAYFSLDGGNTRLASYATGLDNTLFSGQYSDPLNYPNTGATLTALDRAELSAAGYSIPSPLATGVARSFVAFDNTTHRALADTSQAYSGPVPGVLSEFIAVTADSINVTAASDSWFIHTGTGNDAIKVYGGANVLDGGAGSNFLTGAGGVDSFFVDERGATTDTWSTAVNFHQGDSATVWGVTPADFALNWADNQGAAGYTGLTLHATAAGRPTASLTISGYTTAALSNGSLSVTYGSVNGSSYMYVHADR